MSKMYENLVSEVQRFIDVGVDYGDIFVVIDPANDAVGAFLKTSFPEEFCRGIWWSLRHHYRTRARGAWV